MAKGSASNETKRRIKMSENIIEKAIMFATLAHAGDIRKSEPDKPKIKNQRKDIEKE